MLTAAPLRSWRPASMPPVSEIRSTSGESARACADALSWTQHEVDDPRRRAGLLEEPREVDRAERRDLGGLHDGGVARGEGRRDLPAELEERVVPRRDEGAYADRLVDDAADRVRVAGVDRSAVGLLAGELGVVAEDLRDVGHVPAALAHGLAGVLGLLDGERLEVAVDEVGDAIEQRGALGGRGARPVGRVEGAAGRGDGLLHLRVRGDVDLGDDRSVGRVDDGAARAVAGRDPLTVDEQARHGIPQARATLSAGAQGSAPARSGVKPGDRVPGLVPDTVDVTLVTTSNRTFVPP